MAGNRALLGRELEEFTALAKEVAADQDARDEDERRIKLINHLVKEYGLGIDTITLLVEEFAY